MSRSRRKPYHACACHSTKTLAWWKRSYNRIIRRTSKHRIATFHYSELDDLQFPNKKLKGNVWDGPRDGKQYRAWRDIEKWSRK